MTDYVRLDSVIDEIEKSQAMCREYHQSFRITCGVSSPTFEAISKVLKSLKNDIKQIERISTDD